MARQKTMGEMIIKQFLRHRLAVVGLVIIGLMGIVALFAPLLAELIGHSPDDQNVFHRYKPIMTKIQVAADKREIAVEQFIERQPELARSVSEALVQKNLATSASDWQDPLYEFIETHEPNKALELIKANYTADLSVYKKMISGFNKTYILGTDELGRDVLVRLIYAARVSIGVGILVALISGFIALIVGCIAGFYGGIVDSILMRFTESILALPLIPLLIVFASIDFSKLPLLSSFVGGENESIYKMIFILCFFQWMRPAVLIRASILSIKEQEFVQAATALGAFDWRIITRHIVPNVVAPLIVAVTLGVGDVIQFEAALSFLGLGIQPPTPSWGNMLNNAQELIYEAPFLAILPGLLIILTVSSFNFLGDGLQDALDPKAIKRGD